MSIDDMIRLMETVSAQGITSFKYETEEAEIEIKKDAAVVYGTMVKDTVQSQVALPAGASAMTPVITPASDNHSIMMESDKIVNSPLVGTFYTAASPDAEAFVKVGDRVKKGQVLGIIEAMKLMNEVECEVDGVIEAILVQNEEVVEYGQPLFRIR